MKLFQYYVYIMAHAWNNVLYTGITNNLEQRCIERKKKQVQSCNSLVWNNENDPFYSYFT